ncbi:glycosyltransferase [Schleiferiaceae bacterium]|nr:glycosyltransferase [Schleiferiaceae bacterium]
MMNNILVSVLIPTYNVEDFIYDAIVSIQNQSYNNFEIVVVDDGSSDRTVQILETIQITESRLRLFKNEVNSGIVKTLNFGISQCNGEYIMRMDGDDLCHHQKMEKQLNFLVNNKNIHLIGCDIYSIDINDNVLNKIETSHNLSSTNKILKYTCPILHIWMCKKELYTILGGYRELGGSEDYDFLLRMKSNGYNFTNLPYYGYSVRIREGNTQSSNGLMQRKIVYYIRRLYRERLSTKSNIDSFNENDKLKYLTSNIFHRELHNTSVKFTNKAMIYRMQKKYILFFIFASVSIISPYQLLFFIESYYSKYLLKKFN